MKKQLAMTTAMAATLAALSACSSNDGWEDDMVADRDTAICVNQEGERVDDDHCGTRRSGVGAGAFLWYYLGRNAAIPYYGESVRHRRYWGQGSYQPTPGAGYVRAPVSSRLTRSQAVSRGGLGSSSRRYGGSGRT